MAQKMTKFYVSYLAKGETSPRSDIVEAMDEACALGLMLDEHEAPDEVEMQWVVISRKPPPKAGELMGVRSLDELPPELLKAYHDGLVG